MSGPALSAHVFVACRCVQWDGIPGPKTTRTLEQVSYVYQTDEPGGFPCETEFWLFARLAHARRREFTRELRFSLIWHDDPSHGREVWNRVFQTVTFRPGVTVRDLAAPFSVVFEGRGRYEIQLWYPAVRRWDRTKRRRLLARTHLRIED